MDEQMQVFLSSYGFIHPGGFGGRDRSLKNHSPEERPPKWRTVSDRACDRFGRLDPLSKYVLIAVEMLDLRLPSEGDPYEDMAIILGTGYGSISVDMDFYHTVTEGGGPSPKLFTYTLPNVAMAEVAIRYQIQGMNLCLMAGPQSGLLALWRGVKLLEQGELESCVCIGADFLIEKALGASGEVPFDRPSLSAFAFAFLLEKEGDPRKQILSPLARISSKPAESETEEKTPWEALGGLCEFLRTPSKRVSSTSSLSSLGILEKLQWELLG